MKFQPIVEEDPEEVRSLYKTLSGWRALVKISETKSQAPPHMLKAGQLPVTYTVVRATIQII